ncbi:glycosyltransferase [Candidatus Sulfurimonas baltica]|uniref:Glycosyltransferase n=1 Tax=Candidatus Sulfurimonas baltica TaxID=2740404 RepID=A0A7S7LWJ9_9BACT|nr:glycosyltransferase [Candidatus Sulfurimonas baltica]QOY52690.1 glycosyltransferase [Candidatus Sulfurimonas baltica]
MHVLINAIGITDSGGITVLENVLIECSNDEANSFYIICNDNININRFYIKYSGVKNFEFKIIKNRSFLYRLYYENIVFNMIIQNNNIDLVYNFSGTAQFFLKTHQITKVHNLLFYSKKIGKVYFEKKEYLKWFKQILLKRFVFHNMLKRTKYIEVQSSHVKECISDFLDIGNKMFYIKSDIDVSNDLFSKPKEYDFRKKIKFLYIVGPHFEYIHKNFIDFTDTMIEFYKLNIDFEINITLTKEQLDNSFLWDSSLSLKTNFLGYINKEEVNNLFVDNTILISTSIIETLGLHVVEAVQNGILVIAPNEIYSKMVYGDDFLTYELFNKESLLRAIKGITLQCNNSIKDIILNNQRYLIENENKKCKSIIEIFDEVIKDINV